MEVEDLERYLRPSELCDFDQEIIKQKAEEITSGAETDREKAERIFDFCQNKILFAYGNWNEKASEILRKGKGMCSGKSNLAVALLRAVKIPARHKGAILEGQSEMWKFISGRDNFLAEVLSSLPRRRDHIVCEVFLDGKWEIRDVTRDRKLEEGMKFHGISLEEDLAEVETIEDFDRWAAERQKRASLSQNREEILRRINQFVEMIRNSP